MPTNKDKAGTVRKVYVLDAELAERIVEFQAALGLNSEAEAARRLLTAALEYRDTYSAIVARFQNELSAKRSVREAASNVLAGHQLVQRIEFHEQGLLFAVRDGMGRAVLVTIDSSGGWSATDYEGHAIDEGCVLKPQEARHVA